MSRKSASILPTARSAKFQNPLSSLVPILYCHRTRACLPCDEESRSTTHAGRNRYAYKGSRASHVVVTCSQHHLHSQFLPLYISRAGYILRLATLFSARARGCAARSTKWLCARYFFQPYSALHEYRGGGVPFCVSIIWFFFFVFFSSTHHRFREIEFSANDRTNSILSPRRGRTLRRFFVRVNDTLWSRRFALLFAF